MLTDTPAATRSTRSGAALVDWKFLVACLGMAGLLVLSLFTGVYDVTGAADGTEMFWLTRVPRTAALVLADAALSMAGLVMLRRTSHLIVDAPTVGTTLYDV